MKINRKEKREVRHQRLRQQVKGTAARPRMAIFISNAHMYVQFVDDVAGATLASVTTLGTEAKVNIASAKTLGEKAADVAVAKNIGMVVVDRGGFRFHGRVKAIVDAAVGKGLKISEKPPKAPKEKPVKEEAPAKKDKGEKGGDKGGGKEKAPKKEKA